MRECAPPPGFVREDAEGAISVVREDCAQGARVLGLLARDGIARAFALGASLGGGRTPAALLRWPESGREVVLRRLRHGGLLGPVLRGAYLGPQRVLCELSVTTALATAAAPEALVPRAVLALARRLGGPLWECAIATERVQGIDLFAALTGNAAEREDALAAAAGAARRFHDLGGRHADLNASNVLLGRHAGALAATLIDLDRARIAAPVPARRRVREIARLWRSLAMRRDARLDPSERATFLRHYCAGDEDLLRALEAALARARARGALAGWRLPRR